MTKYWIWRIITNSTPYSEPRFQWEEFTLTLAQKDMLARLDSQVYTDDGEASGNWALVKEK